MLVLHAGGKAAQSSVNNSFLMMPFSKVSVPGKGTCCPNFRKICQQFYFQKLVIASVPAKFSVKLFFQRFHFNIVCSKWEMLPKFLGKMWAILLQNMSVANTIFKIACSKQDEMLPNFRFRGFLRRCCDQFLVFEQGNVSQSFSPKCCGFLRWPQESSLLLKFWLRQLRCSHPLGLVVKPHAQMDLAFVASFGVGGETPLSECCYCK